MVKGYHAEEREAGVFATGVERLYQNVVRSLTATSLLSLAATAILGIVGATVMWLGARQEMAHKITLGDYFTYTMFLAFMVAPVFQVVNVGTQLTEAIAGLDRTSEILAEREEDAEPGRTVSLGPIDGDVKFEDVHFAYEADKPVLHGISFHARPGTVTALVGSSGSGKSTIISLICAFHKPTSGQVLVDGTDLSTVRLNSYRSQLGVVLQESFLFDGTIRENVVFSRPNATEEQFLNACTIARVDEFALRFPDGYDTIVGERGVKLSGGQRQRLSIARAILADPRILILDEATSSLDSESEAMIQNGLSYLMQGRTTFRDCPSPVDHSQSRSDPGGGGRPDSRARHALQPLRSRRPLPRPVHPPAWTRGQSLSRAWRRRKAVRRAEVKLQITPLRSYG